jgi:hypothetical protein
MIICNVCEGSGFINLHQLEGYSDPPEMEATEILKWLETHDDNDISVCRCCGDGYGWYGARGRHYTSLDPHGDTGPYAYNGGLCECQ